MDRLAFEAELRREGYSVVNASLKPNCCAPDHVHDFDAKLLVLGGEITLIRDGASRTFVPGECCEIPDGCLHATKTGPEGVAYLVGKAVRRSAAA